MTHHTALNVGFHRWYIIFRWICVWDRQAEGDGCVVEQGRMNTPGFSQSPGLLSLFSTRCSECLLFEVVRGHSWSVCSFVGRQWRGKLAIPLKRLRSRCAVALFAWGHPCQYLQVFTAQCLFPCETFWNCLGVFVILLHGIPTRL